MQEKTEKPTSYKLKKAREKGSAVKSIELAGAILLIGTLLLLWSVSSLLDKRILQIFFNIFSQLQEPCIEEAFSLAFTPILSPMVGILLGIMCIGTASHLIQTGWMWIWKHPKNKKMRGRLVFPLLKICAAGLIGYLKIRSTCFSIQQVFSSPREKQIYFFKESFYLLLEVAAAWLFLGLCDFFYQKWKFNRQMSMSRQELKEEQREREGDRDTKRKMFKK